MKKIPSLFVRDPHGERLVRPEIVPTCEWVAVGEGIATVKHDGTACLIRAGVLYKRYSGKAGSPKIPANFELIDGPDPLTNKVFGWVPVGLGPEDQYHREAFDRMEHRHDGTYELVGPRIQGGAEAAFTEHTLVHHGWHYLPCVPRDFEGIRAYLAEHPIEGVVWWRDTGNPDCDKCKAKRKDWALPWPIRKP